MVFRDEFTAECDEDDEDDGGDDGGDNDVLPPKCPRGVYLLK